MPKSCHVFELNSMNLVWQLADFPLIGIHIESLSRQNKYDPKIGFGISPSRKVFDFVNATIVVSVLESSYPILNRLLKVNPQLIIRLKRLF